MKWLVLVLVLAGASAEASWSVGGEALFLDMGTCPKSFAVAESEGASKGFNLTDGDGWGFRVSGGYACDCLFAELGYTWWEGTGAKVAKKGNFELLALPLIEGSSTLQELPGRIVMQFQDADLRLGKFLCSYLYAYGDVRWAKLQFNVHAQAADTQGNTFFHNWGWFEGGGLGAGLGAEVSIACGLSFILRGGITGMVGHRREGDLHLQSGALLPLTGLNWFGDRETVVVPAADLRIGVEYVGRCGCLDWAGQVGYRFDYYRHAGLDVLSGFSFDYGLGGLFAGLRVGF